MSFVRYFLSKWAVPHVTDLKFPKCVVIVRQKLKKVQQLCGKIQDNVVFVWLLCGIYQNSSRYKKIRTRHLLQKLILFMLKKLKYLYLVVINYNTYNWYWLLIVFTFINIMLIFGVQCSLAVAPIKSWLIISCIHHAVNTWHHLQNYAYCQLSFTMIDTLYDWHTTMTHYTFDTLYYDWHTLLSYTLILDFLAGGVN